MYRNTGLYKYIITNLQEFPPLKYAQPIPSDDVPDMQRQTILSIGIHLEDPASAPSNLSPQFPYRSRIEMIPKLIHIQKQLTVHVVLQRKRRSVSESPHFQFTPKEKHPLSGMPFYSIMNVQCILRMLTGQKNSKQKHSNTDKSGNDPSHHIILQSVWLDRDYQENKQALK